MVVVKATDHCWNAALLVEPNLFSWGRIFKSPRKMGSCCSKMCKCLCCHCCCCCRRWNTAEESKDTVPSVMVISNFDAVKEMKDNSEHQSHSSTASGEFEVERSSITLGKVIGKGAFGEVLKGRWNNTSDDIAVKKLTPGTMAPNEFLREAEIMKNLRHPNLLTLLAVVSEEPIYIVMEYMPNGSLLDYLRTGEGRNSNTQDHINMATQIACGMQYLESIKYIHRDLRAVNVLVGEGTTYKIADFGLSRLIKDEEYRASAGSKFPYKWSAIECLTHRLFTVKSDVWSYGIVLYEIVTRGRIPYAEMSNSDVLPWLESEKRMLKPGGCPDIFYAIMMKCWNKEPAERPSFAYLLETFGKMDAQEIH